MLAQLPSPDSGLALLAQVGEPELIDLALLDQRGRVSTVLRRTRNRLAMLGVMVRARQPIPRRSPQNTDVIVSLTSYPRRIGVAWQAIGSLLRQTFPSRVVLVLSLEEFPDRLLPRRLDRLKMHGLEIMWVARNSRSYKKLLPLRAAEPTAVIVTADDDTYYPRWWLSALMQEHERRPGHVLAHRARKISLRQDGRPCPYVQWGPATMATPSKRVFATGCGGILYPPEALPDVTLDEELALRLCPTNDDVWFWAMTLLGNTQRAAVSDTFRNFIGIPRSQAEALFDVNVREGQNDVQIGRVLDHFGLWQAVV